MPVPLSIKNVPDDVAQRLRAIAAANHRSLQGELLATITEKASASPARMNPAEFLAWNRARAVQSRENSVDLIRADRDSR